MRYRVTFYQGAQRVRVVYRETRRGCSRAIANQHHHSPDRAVIEEQQTRRLVRRGMPREAEWRLVADESIVVEIDPGMLRFLQG